MAKLDMMKRAALNSLDIHWVGPLVEEKEEGTWVVEVAVEGEPAQEEDVGERRLIECTQMGTVTNLKLTSKIPGQSQPDLWQTKCSGC